MSRYEFEVKKLDKVISDLEAKLKIGFDPAFHEMLQHFKELREKYQHLLDARPYRRSGDTNTPYWSNMPPDRQ